MPIPPKHKRCDVIVQNTGAGQIGPHRCTFRYSVVINGKRMCMTHVRQYLRQRGCKDEKK